MGEGPGERPLFKSMNFFLELRKHGKLAEKRSPMYDKGKFAKYFMYFMAIFWAGYLIFFGTLFAFALQGEAVEPYHIMNAGFIFFMGLDFLMRFPFQTLPTQEVKPYLLLPVKRNRVLDFLLIRSGMSSFNLVWLFFFVPFGLFTVVRFYGFTGLLTYNIGVWLLMVFNNYWFLLCRTLINERVWYVALPIAVYGVIGCALFIPEETPWFDLSTDLGEGFIQGKVWVFLGVIACIAVMWFLNRCLMSRLVYSEVNKVEDTKVKHVSEYKFLDRYGLVGEYMRLELKLLLRNKICKTSLRTVIILVLIFSLAISFSSVYDDMREFFMVYNFVIVGMLFLSAIMSYEGNYIDGLMSRKESIYTLLQAKYILYGIGILIPFILMIPTVVMGKLPLLSCISWALFVAGPVYCCLFQLAVYNKNTIDLNTKMTSRKNIGTGLQNLISGAAFGVPLVLYYTLTAFIGETATAWILIIIGISFIATYPIWLKNVYHRFMARRYTNMEGFRDSRQ